MIGSEKSSKGNTTVYHHAISQQTARGIQLFDKILQRNISEKIKPVLRLLDETQGDAWLGERE